MLDVLIRPETSDDHAAIRDVIVAAMDVSDATLVDRLRAAGLVIASLVAVESTRIVGHILFSRLRIHTANSSINAVALAPMAVVPDRQLRGIGSALIREGLQVCRAAGERIVIVVGHPDYYPRFGFSAALARALKSPWNGPAFMALELTPGALDGVRGDVIYPAAFDDFS